MKKLPQSNKTNLFMVISGFIVCVAIVTALICMTSVSEKERDAYAKQALVLTSTLIAFIAAMQNHKIRAIVLKSIGSTFIKIGKLFGGTDNENEDAQTDDE